MPIKPPMIKIKIFSRYFFSPNTIVILLKGFLIISIIMFAIQAIPLRIYNGQTLQKKLAAESVMYQICDHVKSLIILTIPMENQMNLLKEIKKNIPNTEQKY